MKSLVPVLALFMVGSASMAAPSLSAGTADTNSSMAGTASGARPFVGFPIGTSSGAAPLNSLGQPLSPGVVNYYNNPGLGYFSSTPYSQQLPANPMSVNVGGGYYSSGTAAAQNGYWRSPSGIYYPWYSVLYVGSKTYPQMPAPYTIENGQMRAATPQISLMITDMHRFLEDAKSRSLMDPANFEYATNRLNDIEARFKQATNGGAVKLSASEEDPFRRELDMLSADLSRALTP